MSGRCGGRPFSFAWRRGTAGIGEAQMERPRPAIPRQPHSSQVLARFVIRLMLWRARNHGSARPRHTREADRRRGGREAVIKLEAQKANQIAQTTSTGLGMAPKTEGGSK
jgi:hypothetical protein